MKKSLQRISKYRPSLMQGRLDFAGARQSISLHMEHPLEQRVFQILCIALGVLIAGYLYFVSASVLNIMANREAESSIAAVQSSIASLETQYFALDKDVTPAMAQTLGLAPVADPQYVYVPGNAASAGTLATKAI